MIRILSTYACMLLLLLLSNDLSGQLNVQAGINSASIRFSVEGLSIETGSTSGFHAGINYRNRISSKFFFAPGLIFTQKGGSIDFAGDEGELNSNYLEIPLMFVYQSNEAKGFFAEGGVTFAYLLSIDDGESDDTEGFKSTDVGLGLGLGYDFGQIILGVRGVIGITSIADDPDLAIDDVSVTNSVGMLYGAVKF